MHRTSRPPSILSNQAFKLLSIKAYQVKYPSLNLLPLLLLALLCFGCSNKPPPVPTEIPSSPRETSANSSDSDSVDTPERELLDKGKRLFGASLFTAAKRSFEELRDGYPFGPFAEYADLKIGDCHFYLREYEAAKSVFEEFSKQHPSSNSLPYALLMAGRSAQLTNRGVGRDSAPLEQSLTIYNNLITRFPSSIYAVSAEEFRNQVLKQLAAYDLYIADLYKKLGQDKAYQARAKKLEQRWANVQQVKNVFDQSIPETPQIIRADFANSNHPVHNTTINVVSSVDSKQGTKQTAEKLKKFNSNQQTSKQLESDYNTPQLLAINCASQPNEPSFLLFDRELDETELTISNTESSVLLAFNRVKVDQKTIRSCPGLQLSLKSGQNGDLITIAGNPSIVNLANPSRLMLLPQ